MHKNILEILEKIEDNKFNAYIVGGYVRDYCMKKETLDVDICTNAKPKDLINIFKDAVLPKDIYGAVTLKCGDMKVEITTFRKELVYDNRKPIKIEYTNDLLEDLERRDFTINTLCMNKNGEIIDLFDGKKDIDKKIIKSIGDAKAKFIEDPLRILRAIRFATIYNFKLDKDVISAIKETKECLKNISYDRKKSELNKIFGSSNIKYGIKLLQTLELDNSLEINLKKLKPTTDILVLCAQLDSKYPFTKIEKDTIDDINIIIKNKTISKYEIYKYGLYKTSIAAEILGINKKVIVKLERNLKIHKRNDIMITTDEILKLTNKKAGAWLSDLYEDLEKKIVNNKLENTNEKIKDYILKQY